jgi:hypothetical protein
MKRRKKIEGVRAVYPAHLGFTESKEQMIALFVADFKYAWEELGGCFPENTTQEACLLLADANREISVTYHKPINNVQYFSVYLPPDVLETLTRFYDSGNIWDETALFA